MNLKITYNVGNVVFTATAENIVQAYEYTAAIIKANSIIFPNQERELSEYMAILAQFKDGKHLICENHVFKIEVDRPDERIQHLTETAEDAESTLLKLYGTCGKYGDGLIEGYQERKKAREAKWGESSS